jgi:simple sugar transport system substrate-binding protein
MPPATQVWTEGKAFRKSAQHDQHHGPMEYGKAIAGCAAALSTQTGQIGYLGPLINDETRRLAASAYLGAKHCWTEYLAMTPPTCSSKSPGSASGSTSPASPPTPPRSPMTSINSGYDVVISGIDTTEGLTEAKKAAEAARKSGRFPTTMKAPAKKPRVCLGVPYFNWGPITWK